MILKSAKFENCKTFGRADNILYCDPHITAIIGKNETGKSNLLLSLGCLDFIKGANNDVFKTYSNRFDSPDSPPVVSIMLSYTPYEMDLLNLKETDTTFQFNINQDIRINGALSKHLDSQIIADCINALKESSNYFHPNSSAKQYYDTWLPRLTNVKNKIIPNYEAFKSADQYLCNLIPDSEKKASLQIQLENAYEHIRKAYELLPSFFLYRDKVLSPKYVIDDKKLEVNHSTEKDIIYELLNICGISQEDLKKACSPNGKGRDKKDAIVRLFHERIAVPFNEYYRQESIDVVPDITNNEMRIFIKLNGVNMDFSERSNGLRWYLSLFIGMLSSGSTHKRMILLLDEPGVHLHVDAQKHLLDFLGFLCKNNNQVLYTTHSPFMINTQEVARIHALEKEDGVSRIINKLYHSEQKNMPSLETLSPLFKAIGMRLSDNLGPNKESINLVVEGIDDGLYVSAMLDHLHTNGIQIIPSIGADNIPNIISILIGWGYPVAILLDCDKKGSRNADLLINHLGLEMQKEVFFVTCAEKYDPKNPKTIEDMIDPADNDKLTSKYDKSNSLKTKTLAAKEFNDLVTSHKLIPSETTVNYFQKLFQLIIKNYTLHKTLA